MRAATIVLTCLACTGLGRRMQVSRQSESTVEEAKPLKALATLLASSGPATAWQPSALSMPAAGGHAVTQRRVAPQPAAQRADSPRLMLEEAINMQSSLPATMLLGDLFEGISDESLLAILGVGIPVIVSVVFLLPSGGDGSE
mmetsp:Transcript_26114/g.45452  ORF Transcript_26114/g.45452 Transcript_26114/m.45452 type:complete len:143 (-) Transcript_26114:65-493(-)